MAREFDISQFEDYVKKFENLEKEFNTFLKKFLLQMAMRVIAEAKETQMRIPVVDTGAMVSSWGVGSQELTYSSNIATRKIESTATVANIDMVGSNLEITIWNGMDYASFIEYGARNVNGTWRKGYFILTVAIDTIEKQIPARFNRAWAQFLKQYGVT